MADVENPGEDEEMMAAEPSECSRLVCIVLVFFVGCALFMASYSAIDSGNITAVTVLGFFLSFPVLLLFLFLAGDWEAGNPEGKRIVDSLLQYSPLT